MAARDDDDGTRQDDGDADEAASLVNSPSMIVAEPTRMSWRHRQLARACSLDLARSLDGNEGSKAYDGSRSFDRQR